MGTLSVLTFLLRVIVCVVTSVLVMGVPGHSAAAGYVIGEEDVLQISVWGSPDLGTQVPVRPDGMISVPLLGDVKAAGLTTDELKSVLEKEFSRFVKTPTVTVLVTAMNSFKVYVFGEGVARSGGSAGSAGGTITLRRSTTLLQFLAQLGSLKQADLENAYITRDGQRLKVDFHRLVAKGDLSQDLQLRPNDVIFIPDNMGKRIRVVGAVRTPTILQYTDGMTALDAVLSAGGFTEFASRNNVIVIRKEGSETRNIEVRLKDVFDGDVSKNVLLEPGDVVTVKTSIF